MNHNNHDRIPHCKLFRYFSVLLGKIKPSQRNDERNAEGFSTIDNLGAAISKIYKKKRKKGAKHNLISIFQKFKSYLEIHDS